MLNDSRNCIETIFLLGAELAEYSNFSRLGKRAEQEGAQESKKMETQRRDLLQMRACGAARV